MSSTKEEVIDIDEGIPVEHDCSKYKVTWENRRKMAWISLYSLICITLLYTGIFTLWIDASPEDKLKHLSEIYFWFAMTFASILLGYMGSTSIPHLWKR